MSAAAARSRIDATGSTAAYLSFLHDQAVPNTVGGRWRHLFGRKALLRAVKRHSQLVLAAGELLFENLPASLGEKVTHELQVFHHRAQLEQWIIAGQLRAALITHVDAEDIYRVISILTELIGDFQRIDAAAILVYPDSFPPKHCAIRTAARTAAEAVGRITVELTNRRKFQEYVARLYANSRALRTAIRESISSMYLPSSTPNFLLTQLHLLRQYAILQNHVRHASNAVQQIYFKNT